MPIFALEYQKTSYHGTKDLSYWKASGIYTRSACINTFDAMSFGSSEFKLYQLGYPNQELKEGFLIQLGGNFFFFHIDNVLVNSNDEDMSELTYPHLSFISACPNTVSRLPNNNSLRSSGECQFPNREAGNPLSALI